MTSIYAFRQSSISIALEHGVKASGILWYILSFVNVSTDVSHHHARMRNMIISNIISKRNIIIIKNHYYRKRFVQQFNLFALLSLKLLFKLFFFMSSSFRRPGPARGFCSAKSTFLSLPLSSYFFSFISFVQLSYVWCVLCTRRRKYANTQIRSANINSFIASASAFNTAIYILCMYVSVRYMATASVDDVFY